MALIGIAFTMEVILLIIGLYLFDTGGLIRKFSAVGMFIFGLGTALGSQNYVSDLSALPANVFLKYPGNIQNDWAFMFSVLTMITFALTFINIYKIADLLKDLPTDPVARQKRKLELIMEEIV